MRICLITILVRQDKPAAPLNAIAAEAGESLPRKATQIPFLPLGHPHSDAPVSVLIKAIGLRAWKRCVIVPSSESSVKTDLAFLSSGFSGQSLAEGARPSPFSLS